MIELSVRNVDFADPSGGLSAGDVDVALLWLPAPEDIKVIPLLDDVRMAVLAADHPLAAKAEISAAELAEQPFVWIEGMDSVNRDYWTLAEHRGGRPARIGATITGFEDLFAAVRAGQAVSASPSMVVGSLPWPDIAIRPITGLAPTTLAVCHRRGGRAPRGAGVRAQCRQLSWAVLTSAARAWDTAGRASRRTTCR